MDLDQLRHEMTTTGRVEIARHRGTCLRWALLYLALVVVGAVCAYAATFGGGPIGLILVALLFVGVGLAGAVQFAPGVLGGSSVVVDGAGVRVGRRLAPWSEVAAVDLRTVTARGTTTYTVALSDAEGRSPFHAPGVRGEWWRRSGRMLPGGLVVSELELHTFLTEQHETTR